MGCGDGEPANDSGNVWWCMLAVEGVSSSKWKEAKKEKYYSALYMFNLTNTLSNLTIR